jgi:hypothetical protein
LSELPPVLTIAFIAFLSYNVAQIARFDVKKRGQKFLVIYNVPKINNLEYSSKFWIVSIISAQKSKIHLKNLPVLTSINLIYKDLSTTIC